jgi:hypothetical protein
LRVAASPRKMPTRRRSARLRAKPITARANSQRRSYSGCSAVPDGSRYCHQLSPWVKYGTFSQPMSFM